MSETRKTAEIGEQVMSRVQEQKAQTDQVAAAIFELETSATEVARSSDHVRREVGEANDESQRGRHLMQANRGGIEQLATDIAGAMAITHKLEGYSSNIGNILEVIRGMAEQTNLLALNAAIEAARAGKPGGALPWWPRRCGRWLPVHKGRPRRSGDDRQPAGMRSRYGERDGPEP